MFELQCVDPLIKDNANSIEFLSENIKGNISFKNVTFSYPNEDRRTGKSDFSSINSTESQVLRNERIILNDFSCEIPIGKNVAIVGTR
jgi:ABC-type multidrug transport system fused ATPase/permease subunit